MVKDFEIVNDTNIWEFANIYKYEIGNDCNIGSYVEIQNGVKIGDRVAISSHSFICSLVEVEDDVFVGHGVMTINEITHLK
ncbi:hypothetical protein E3V55_04320 [Candidatus Marinimicrobia bacterium MT.SAG.3]|nr:hypothetical protein E3V55_04320 [Candidatus Marinimicrobia bacterium MT.SAG.3]